MSRGGTLSVAMARPVLAALERCGIPAEPVLRAAHVSREGLESIENRLPAERIHALWQEAATASRDPSFGVHVARELPAGTLDVIEYLFASSKNLGDGLERVVAYNRLLEDPTHLRLVVEPLLARVIRAAPVPAPQMDEFAITLLFLRARQATRVDWAPERVRFTHGDGGRVRELERLFGCKVAFDAPETSVAFKRGLLELPFERSDSRLLAILERYAGSLLDQLPEHGTIAARASHAVALEMGRRLPTLAATAAALHIPTRTLQRQLEQHGLAHSKLVDDVRRGLALRHIGDAALSITEIGYLLHFSDTTAFSRAFKRWTGLTPQRYRERLLFGQAHELARRD